MLCDTIKKLSCASSKEDTCTCCVGTCSLNFAFLVEKQHDVNLRDDDTTKGLMGPSVRGLKGQT